MPENQPYYMPTPGPVTIDESEVELFDAKEAASMTKESSPGKDWVGKAKEALLRPPAPGDRSMFGEPEILAPVGNAIRSAGEMLLPGSATELLTDVALGGMSKAQKVFKAVGLSDFMSKAASYSLPATTAATSEAVQGRAASPGALTGATASAISYLFGKGSSVVGSFFSNLNYIPSQKLYRRIGNELGPELTNSIAKDIPSLKFKLGGLDDVMELVTPEGSKEVLSDVFTKLERSISKKLKKTSISIPEDAMILASSAGKTQPVAPTGNLLSMAIDDVLKLRRDLNDIAFKAPSGPSGLLLRETARDVQNRVLQATKAADTSLGNRYETLIHDWGKTLSLRDILIEDFNSIFPRISKGGSTFDPVRLHSQIMKHYDDITPNRFKNLHEFFSGGERGVGPRYEQMSKFSGARLAFGKGVRAVDTIPTLTYVDLPANMRQILDPTRSTLGSINKSERIGRAAGMASVPTLAEVTGAKAQPEPIDLKSIRRRE